MSNVHGNFEKVINELGFRKNYKKEYWKENKSGTEFILDFEGYAYVLYRKQKYYSELGYLVAWIFSRLKGQTFEITRYCKVPIHHFRKPEKLKEFMVLLLDNSDFDEDKF